MNDVVLVRMIEVLLTCYPTGTVAPFVNIFTSYAREIVNQPSVHKQRFLPLLRLLVAVHEGAPFGSGIEEDRKRKDYQVQKKIFFKNIFGLFIFLVPHRICSNASVMAVFCSVAARLTRPPSCVAFGSLMTRQWFRAKQTVKKNCNFNLGIKREP